MKIIEPSVLVPLSEISSEKLKLIERYGRVCYKSEDRISQDSVNIFLKGLIKSGHESVIEHEKATVVIITDRGITHEIVRHRIGSYSQESTRYCNYSNHKFGNEITFIKPFFYSEEKYKVWENACALAEEAYFELVNNGQPQEARSVLPNSLKAEIVVTYNLREWRHFFKLRCSANAHPQMRQVAIPLLLTFKKYLPCLFEDVSFDGNFKPNNYAKVILTDKYFQPSELY